MMEKIKWKNNNSCPKLNLMAMNTNYTPLNLVGFALTGFGCISIVVFLTSTQPFFISEAIGIPDNQKIGSIIGSLGFVDELTAIVFSPLIGTLHDYINGSNSMFSGSKIIVSIGFLCLSASLLGYSQFANSIFPALYLFRIIFALGVSSCMSMVTVMLNELANSDFHIRKFIFWKQVQRIELNSEETTETSGKYASLIGISTGLGAVFSVAFFLTLPVKLSNNNPDLSMKASLKLSYLLICAISLGYGIIMFLVLYNSKRGQHASLREEKEGYLKRLWSAIELSKTDKSVQLAYVGSFVAKASTITTSVFIPLLVYNYYQKKGLCESDGTSEDIPSKQTCYNGYIFAAILTGVSQTISLVSAPFWGWLIDSRIGKVKTLFIVSISGTIANLGICILGTFTNLYNPKSVSCFIFVSLIGFSQIGAIITSMSILSELKQHPNIGGISGLFSLCGGLGILLISKLGGSWSDSWILAPFFLLSTFYLILAMLTNYRSSSDMDYEMLED